MSISNPTTPVTAWIDPWAEAKAACSRCSDRELLRHARHLGWTALEFAEYARACFRPAKKDYATPYSYRAALKNFESETAILWRERFRANGGEPLPPRNAYDLEFPTGSLGIGPQDRYWSWHTPEFVAMIEQRARTYFCIPDALPVSQRAWEASCRAYWREVHNEARKAERAYRKALKEECVALEAQVSV